MPSFSSSLLVIVFIITPMAQQAPQAGGDAISINIRTFTSTARIDDVQPADTIFSLKARIQQALGGTWHIIARHGRVDWDDAATVSILGLANEEHLIALPCANSRKSSLLRGLVAHGAAEIRPFGSFLHACEPTAPHSVGRGDTPQHPTFRYHGTPTFEMWDPSRPIELAFHLESVSTFVRSYPQCRGRFPSSTSCLLLPDSDPSCPVLTVFEMGEGGRDGIPPLYLNQLPKYEDYVNFPIALSSKLTFHGSQTIYRTTLIPSANSSWKPNMLYHVLVRSGPINTTITSSDKNQEEEEVEEGSEQEEPVNHPPPLLLGCFHFQTGPSMGPIVDELLEGVQDSGALTNVTILHSGGEIHSFESLLCGLEGEGPELVEREKEGEEEEERVFRQKEWEVRIGGDYSSSMVDSEGLFRLLAGSEDVVSHFGPVWSISDAKISTFVAYYDLLRSLKLNSRLLAMVHRITIPKNILTYDLFRLFQECHARFDEDPSNDEFNTALTVAVLSRIVEERSLRGSYDSILATDLIYREWFRTEGYERFFVSERIPDDISPFSHPDVNGCCAVLDNETDLGILKSHRVSFCDVTSSLLGRVLDRENVSSNIRLVTSDDPNGGIPTQLELFYLRSDFFRKCLRFGGTEFDVLRDEGKMLVNDLTKKQLELVMQFYFTDSLPDDVSLTSVIPILQHAEKFEGIDFQRRLVFALRKQDFLVRPSFWDSEQTELTQELATELMEWKNFERLLKGWLRAMDRKSVKTTITETKAHFQLVAEGGSSEADSKFVERVLGDLRPAPPVEPQQEEEEEGESETQQE